MPPYHFPGYPAFLDAAAAGLDLAAAAGPARRIAALSAVATLCSQAAESDPSHVAGILAEAEALGNQLKVAHRAAELMIADLRAGRLPGPAAVAAPIAKRGRGAAPSSEPRGGTRRHG